MVTNNDKNLNNLSSDDDSAIVWSSAGSVSLVSELNESNREAICKTASVLHVQRNDQIRPENSHRWLMYLVEGSLTLYSGKDEIATVNARTTEATKPLFQDKGSNQSARTNTVAKIVRFGREQLNILLNEQQKNAVSVHEVQVGELDNLIFDDVLRAITSNSIVLASTAKSAERILNSYNSVASIPELAEVIQCDVGLASHLVNVANRIDGGTTESTSSIRGAITRLGVMQTKGHIKDLLQSNTIQPACDAVQNCLNRYVQRTELCVAIVQVLAKEVPQLKPEVAMLVALSADIGELLVISYANNHPEKFKDERELAEVIRNLRVLLSAWLIDAWDYPQEFVNACQTSRDWYRNHSGEITYTDLVTAALLIIQSEQPDTENNSIPSADNLLLARRLQQAGIDLTSPGDILKAASSRLINVQSLLKAS
ncbi:MAG: HDOD domain-containing protein [Granulosicoccus sp.]|nr:HDOD domain-containing protein [Granulosicoccus sp.]